MITFILSDDRKINAFEFPEDSKKTWVGLYNYDDNTETLFFFGSKDYLLSNLRWVEVELDDVPDTDLVMVKKIEIV